MGAQLVEHTQKVVFNGSLSSWEDLSIGVLQESVLGLVLSIVINDLDDGAEYTYKVSG